jgi:hypothetical protein
MMAAMRKGAGHEIGTKDGAVPWAERSWKHMTPRYARKLLSADRNRHDGNAFFQEESAFLSCPAKSQHLMAFLNPPFTVPEAQYPE